MISTGIELFDQNTNFKCNCIERMGKLLYKKLPFYYGTYNYQRRNIRNVPEEKN